MLSNTRRRSSNGSSYGILLDVQHVRAQPRQLDAPDVDLHALLFGSGASGESSASLATSSSDMS